MSRESDSEQESPVESQTDEDEKKASCSEAFDSLFRNRDIPVAWRFGIPIYLIMVLGLLLASHIGSGVAAFTTILPAPNDNLLEPVTTELLEASVFTSIHELWKVGGKGLAILVALGSVSWPYIKVLLSLYVWMVPININNIQRRDRLLSAIDVLGKWSFVDIIIFTEIVTIFRSTNDLGGPVLEVYIVPRWGFFGFISATFMSLIGAHVIHYFHRKVVHKDVLKDSRGLKSLANLSSLHVGLLGLLIVLCFALYLVGCFLGLFNITSYRGDVVGQNNDYTLVEIGKDLQYAAFGEPGPDLGFLQFMWYLLGMIMPLLSICLLGLLLFLPYPAARLRQVLVAAEIAFAWSCSEVYIICTIFAVREVPTFGHGLIDSGCDACYVMESHILSEFSVITIATALQIVLFAIMLRISHRSLHGPISAGSD